MTTVILHVPKMYKYYLIPLDTIDFDFPDIAIFVEKALTKIKEYECDVDNFRYTNIEDYTGLRTYFVNDTLGWNQGKGDNIHYCTESKLYDALEQMDIFTTKNIV
jgi:hypothetical protein